MVSWLGLLLFIDANCGETNWFGLLRAVKVVSGAFGCALAPHGSISGVGKFVI